jgi:AcrR family transcriptional regulator
MARPRSGIAPRILRAARRRFLAKGVDGASLRGIATDARTSIGMVYYYFPSKDDLFLAVVESVYLGFLQDLERVLDAGRPVVQRIEGLYRRIGAATPLERDVLRLMLREALTSPARLGRLIRRFRHGHVPLLLSLVRDGFAAGTFAPDLTPPLVLMAMMALGGPGQTMLQVMARRFGLPGMPRPEALAPALVGILMNGVGRGMRRAPSPLPSPAGAGEGKHAVGTRAAIGSAAPAAASIASEAKASAGSAIPVRPRPRSGRG